MIVAQTEPGTGRLTGAVCEAEHSRAEDWYFGPDCAHPALTWMGYGTRADVQDRADYEGGYLRGEHSMAGHPRSVVGCPRCGC